MVKLALYRQEFPRKRIDNIPDEVNKQLDYLLSQNNLKPGSKIAITAGSRGIQNIVLIYKAVVQRLKGAGMEPFLFAAMGSHGGGTVEGQRKVLEGLGITEESVGAPILVTSDTKEIGITSGGIKVYCDKMALSADAILVVNRVKPHTSFRGEIESGLWKMMAVGMGKVLGATTVHKFGSAEIAQNILEIGGVCLSKLSILGGLAIVENSYDETSIIKGILPDKMMDEKQLLAIAKNNLPCLPVDELDLLIVEEMGKNYSGTGMDVNVIGRWKIQDLPEPKRPRIKRLVVLDLTKESEGNANGIGLADLTTRKLVNKIDFNATYLNSFTTTFLARAMLPITLQTDRAAIDAALKTLGKDDHQTARVIRIHNTLQLEHFYASPSLQQELSQKGIVQEGDYAQMLFDEEGSLI